MTQMEAEQKRARTWKNYAYLVFAGMVTGAANVIPGVSGGTMAFIMGIYEELLDAIKTFDLRLAQLLLRGRFRAALAHVPWRFLLPLGAGLTLAVFLLAGLISWLLTDHTVLLYAFFSGLIAASIVSISVEARWTPGALAALLAGTAIAWFLVGMVPREMPHTPLILFLSGVVAIIAMILPGISGSFLLLIMGQYHCVLEGIKTMNLTVLLPVAAGIVVGMLGFVRFLSWLLLHYRQTAITLLTGFMLGSMRKIWPFKQVLETMVDRHGQTVPIRELNVLPDLTEPIFWWALALAILGFFLICALDHAQTRRNPFVRLILRNGRVGG